MRIKHLLLIFCSIAVISASAQTKKKRAIPPATTTATSASTELPRPKLVVGIVVDQMRWDYLYRYYDRYTDNGFKRLLPNEGFSCEKTPRSIISPPLRGPGIPAFIPAPYLPYMA